MEKAYRPLKLVQGSEEWLEARRSRITASEIGCIVGVEGALSSPFEIWLRKKGLLKEVPDNPAMQRGRNYEDLLRQLAEEKSGRNLRPEVVENVKEPWILASLDALSEDETHFWEFKIPGLHTYLMAKHGGVEGLKESVAQYYAQVQWQHLCLGNVLTGNFGAAVGIEDPIPFDVVWPYETFRSNVDVAHVVVPVNEKYQESLLEAGWEFYKLLKKKTLPDNEIIKIVTHFRASLPSPFLEDSPENLAATFKLLKQAGEAINEQIAALRSKFVGLAEAQGKNLDLGHVVVEKAPAKKTLSAPLVQNLLEGISKIKEENKEIEALEEINLDLERLKLPSLPGWRVSIK